MLRACISAVYRLTESLGDRRRATPGFASRLLRSQDDRFRRPRAGEGGLSTGWPQDAKPHLDQAIYNRYIRGGYGRHIAPEIRDKGKRAILGEFPAAAVPTTSLIDELRHSPVFGISRFTSGTIVAGPSGLLASPDMRKNPSLPEAGMRRRGVSMYPPGPLPYGSRALHGNSSHPNQPVGSSGIGQHVLPEVHPTPARRDGHGLSTGCAIRYDESRCVGKRAERSSLGYVGADERSARGGFTAGA